jgi:glycosyltransferase involved in cell wall biosynthesis
MEEDSRYARQSLSELISLEQSLSVIMPALNEEKNIEDAVKTAASALVGNLREFEILVIDDGSEDRTGVIADKLVRKYPFVRTFHNPRVRGLGYSFRRGVEEARCEYCVMVTGKNVLPASSLQKLVQHIGRADILISYFVNPWVRSMSRRILSRTFIAIYNIAFGLKLRYYNGHNVIKTEVLRSMSINTDNSSFMAPILVRLLRSGVSYEEVALTHTDRKFGRTKAFSWKNIVGVGKVFIYLFFDVHFKIARRP